MISVSLNKETEKQGGDRGDGSGGMVWKTRQEKGPDFSLMGPLQEARSLSGADPGHAEGLAPELVSSWTSPRGCLFLISSGL